MAQHIKKTDEDEDKKKKRGGDRDGRSGGGPRPERRDEEENPFVEKLVAVNRVAKVVKGGKRFGFAALIVIGDQKGRVGFASAKAREVPDAVKKATEAAKRRMIRIPLREGRTIHHDVHGHFGAGKVVLRAAPPGTGIISGGPMRAVFEALGIQDIISKSVGTSNPHNMIRATLAALQETMSPRQVASRRSKKVSDIIGKQKEYGNAEAPKENTKEQKE
jgi:small subunit ribosomal protein S5